MINPIITQLQRENLINSGVTLEEDATSLYMYRDGELIVSIEDTTRINQDFIASIVSNVIG